VDARSVKVASSPRNQIRPLSQWLSGFLVSAAWSGSGPGSK